MACFQPPPRHISGASEDEQEESEADDAEQSEEESTAELPSGFPVGRVVFSTLEDDEDLDFGEHGEVLGPSKNSNTPILVRFASGDEYPCDEECLATSPLWPLELEVSDVAAAVSLVLEIPTSSKATAPAVTTVLNDDGSRLEMGKRSDEAYAISLRTFWPKDCELSLSRRQDLFWQFQRSVNLVHDAGMRAAAAMAIVLRDLALNQGVRLMHRGRPVENCLVLNSSMVDVSDIARCAPSVVDQTSGEEVTLLPTFAGQQQQKSLPQAVRARLGLTTFNEKIGGDSSVESACPSWSASSSGGLGMDECMPHRWVACVLGGRAQPAMVHLDICGPALCNFEYRGRGMGRDEVVPLHAFVSPLYFYAPSPCPEGSLKHKFLFLPLDFSGSGVLPVPPELPRHLTSLRHMTSGIEEGSSFQEFLKKRSQQNTATDSPEGTLEGMALATFLERLPQSLLDAELRLRLVAVRDRLVATGAAKSCACVGAPVEVQGLQSRPELNGRKGRIASARGDCGAGRLPVLVSGIAEPIKLKGSCVRFLPSDAVAKRPPQVLGLQEMLQQKGSVKAHLRHSGGEDKRGDKKNTGSPPVVATTAAPVTDGGDASCDQQMLSGLLSSLGGRAGAAGGQPQALSGLLSSLGGSLGSTSNVNTVGEKGDEQMLAGLLSSMGGSAGAPNSSADENMLAGVLSSLGGTDGVAFDDKGTVKSLRKVMSELEEKGV